MKNIPVAIMVLTVLVGSYPSAAEARTVVRSGETVSIANDERITGDFYVAASTFQLSGEVSDDVVAAAGKVTINGTVGADLFVLGGTVDVHGSVGDDVRVIGGDITIAEPVSGDVMIFGGTVKLLSTASVAGDVLIFGGAVEISAPIEGKLLGQMSSLRIDSRIGGDVDVTVESITLGERAVIGGALQYVSDTVVTRAQGAVVTGDVVRNDPVYTSTPATAQSFIVPFLVLLFSVAVWYLLARRSLNRVATRALVPGVRPLIIGVLTITLTPFAIGVLLVSMLGTLVGLALLFAYALFVVLAIVAVPATLGKLLFGLLKKEAAAITLPMLVVGTLVVAVCVAIPLVGPIVIFGFFILQFGAIVDLLIRSGR